MICNFAARNDLLGYVCNSSDGLHIEFNADEKRANNLLKQIVAEAPPLARIEAASLTKAKDIYYDDFVIRESENTKDADLPLTPDFALCEDCRKQLLKATDRRYRYPFITCTQCGPRYSIVRSLPYDRQNTTMQAFMMCKNCDGEYHDQGDRRYFSQTNSCDDCGISLTIYDNQGSRVAKGNKDSIAFITGCLHDGKIVAIKGVGGYLLLCDAANSATIRLLRSRKHRPSKPFAIMCRDVQQAKGLVFLSPAQESLMKSAVSPVLLATARREAGELISFHDIAPGLDSLGIMIPYAPLFEMVLQDFRKAVIATSGNISGSPVVFEDNDAINGLSHVADYIITHDREIVTPQDDSVMRITDGGRRLIIRRSRGMAPSYFGYKPQKSKTILATGALMKSSFTFTHLENVYVSQYLGNTDSYESQQSYRKTLQHLLAATNAKPQVLITDKHPQYFSNELAKELAVHYNAKVYEVQHHKAHFAAVLAENKLLRSEEAILGVIWDGTGLGDDGQIWGGEFFRYENNKMERSCYFDYFPVLLDDKMAREPRLSALAVCGKIPGAEEWLKPKFSEAEWKLYQSILKKGNLLKCSSAGRVFDAVASLLDICHTQSYEGEAALLLETLARQYKDENDADTGSYFSGLVIGDQLPVADLFTGIIGDIVQKKSGGFIAVKFHNSLAHLIKIIASRSGIAHIACSGGVFQNGLLVDLLYHHCGENFKLYFHTELSPNDENISFGQAVYYDNDIDGPG